ncbi:MAG TPA: hypothetical protein VGF45_17260 [Polyangia bacterium]
MSLLVRADEPSVVNELSVDRRSHKTLPRRWVAFSAADAHPTAAVEPLGDAEHYRIEAAYKMEHQRESELTSLDEFGFAIGGQVCRREFLASGRPGGLSGPWLGHLDSARSSSDAEIETLRQSWAGNPFRVALLLACAHLPRFFALKPHERNFDHVGTPDPGALSASAPLARVVRHLHRTGMTSPGGWDTFAYFEMLPADVAYLRAHLAEWRALSAGRRLVEREVELWMVKQVG